MNEMSPPRRSLKEREAKTLLEEFSSRFAASREALRSKLGVEEMGIGRDSLIFVAGRPLILRRRGELFPTLLFEAVTKNLPRVVVDMGAIPHVCNGADVMAPGVRKVEGSFSRDSVVLVVDERFAKPLAIGVAKVSADEMKQTAHGKVVQNIHYVGDTFWGAAKGS